MLPPGDRTRAGSAQRRRSHRPPLPGSVGALRQPRGGRGPRAGPVRKVFRSARSRYPRSSSWLQQPRPRNHPHERLLHQVLRLLARAAQRPGCPVEAVDVIAEAGPVELPRCIRPASPRDEGGAYAYRGPFNTRRQRCGASSFRDLRYEPHRGCEPRFDTSLRRRAPYHAPEAATASATRPSGRRARRPDVDLDHVALGELALEHRERELVDQPLLDHALSGRAP